MALPPTPQKPRTVKLARSSGYTERLATGAITPGHLLYQLSTGKVSVHATQGGYAAKWFAQEEALYSGSSTIGTARNIDTAFVDGDMIGIFQTQSGDKVNARLKAGVAYAVGDQLISAGDGTLKKASAASTGVTVKQIIGEVDVALDLSATGAVATCTTVLVY